MPKPLSERQQSILGFLQEYIRLHRFSPTMREIAREVGISSTSVVKYNLDILERAGQIERDPEVSRGIRLVPSPMDHQPWDRQSVDRYQVNHRPELFQAPILGRLAANVPIPIPDGNLASSTYAASIELPRDLVGDSRDVYALEVEGDSLADALVGDGDIVLIQHLARVSDLAAVWLRDRAQTALGRFYLEGAQVHLHPDNPLLNPASHPAHNVVVMGKVVCVLRHLTG
jgi:repressor LexA